MKKQQKLRNRKYKLLGTTIIITYQDRVEDDDKNWLFGVCKERGDFCHIFISTKDENGNLMTEESMNRTLRHELFHAILDRGLYFNSSSDEPMIEWLTICTEILNKQGVYI